MHQPQLTSQLWSTQATRSFRIGTATTAAAVGLQDSAIQMLGHWRSDCYQLYIKSNTHHLAIISVKKDDLTVVKSRTRFRAAHRKGKGATGEFCPGPQPERGPIKGPLNTCLKDQYTLIEQSGSRYSNRAVIRYSNRAVIVFFRGTV